MIHPNAEVTSDATAHIADVIVQPTRSSLPLVSNRNPGLDSDPELGDYLSTVEVAGDRSP